MPGADREAGTRHRADDHPAGAGVLLVTVLGEIPDKESALKEILNALKPDGYLSITEIIFDPHFQSCKTIRRITTRVGFREKSFYGNRFSYTINLEKPEKSNQ